MGLTDQAKGFIARRQILDVSDTSLTLDDGTTINIGKAEANRLNEFFADGRPAYKAQLEQEQAGNATTEEPEN